MSYVRSVLYSIDPTQLSLVCINDHIGLDPDVSYTLPLYLEDRANYDGVHVLSVSGNLYSFSDGVDMILCQQVEAFDPHIYDDLLVEAS